MTIQFNAVSLAESEIFYRETGPIDAPVLLLLHGFPTASHMFRDLMPLLADRYRIIAPDLPGFGHSVSPDRADFTFSFDNLARVMAEFVDALGLHRYAIYVFDYGAPVGFRLALTRGVYRLATGVGNYGYGICHRRRHGADRLASISILSFATG